MPVVRIRILIGTTVVRIRILIGTTVVRIRILIGTTVVRIACVIVYIYVFILCQKFQASSYNAVFSLTEQAMSLTLKARFSHYKTHIGPAHEIMTLPACKDSHRHDHLSLIVRKPVSTTVVVQASDSTTTSM